jgi:hypothetical protein
MSTTLRAIITLIATLAAFGLLAMLVQAIRNRRPGLFLRGASRPSASKQLGVDEVFPIDTKRRLVLARCGQQQMVLLTGGPTDLVVAVFPAPILPGSIAGASS